MDNNIISIVNDKKLLFGSNNEYKAAKLRKGDSIIFDGKLDKVDLVWFYDGIIVNLESGRKIFPSLGEKFEIL